ncbi:MAG: DUF4412 domain-containing protein [Bacteroidetes bacterium]|nr:DUF4412 domain-containing protein [Bacteroidota bacterium]
MKMILKVTTFLLIALTLYSCQSNTGSSTTDKNSDIKSSGSGGDTYMEMNMKTEGENISMNMLQKIYISHSGKARVEMYTVNNGKASLMMVGLSDAKNPAQSTLIDDSAKTYSINKIDTASGNDMLDQHTKYTVSKIGNETIQGLNCVHAQIIKTMNFSGVQSFMNSSDTTDVWMTKDIPMPSGIEKQFSKGMGIAYNNDVAGQLIQMGCTGFPVKFLDRGKDSKVNSQLTKISHDNFPESMFEVPSGYKETQGF